VKKRTPKGAKQKNQKKEAADLLEGQPPMPDNGLSGRDVSYWLSAQPVDTSSGFFRLRASHL